MILDSYALNANDLNFGEVGLARYLLFLLFMNEDDLFDDAIVEVTGKHESVKSYRQGPVKKHKGASMNDDRDSNVSQGRILIVEDEPVLRKLLAYALQTREHLDVLLAPDAPSALLCLQKAPVDLILADYHMPEMTGIELAGAARCLNGHTPIALMTGARLTLTSAELAQAGISRLFLKPFDLKELVSWIKSVLSSSQRGFS